MMELATLIVIAWIYALTRKEKERKPDKRKRELFIDYCLYIQQIEQERFKRQVRKQKRPTLN